jgi:hypothetical protein
MRVKLTRSHIDTNPTFGGFAAIDFHDMLFCQNELEKGPPHDVPSYPPRLSQ